MTETKSLFFKSVLLLVLLVLAGCGGREPLVVDVTDYGARPGSGEDAAPAVQAALQKIASLNGTPSILHFPAGRYDFWAKDAPKMFYAVTAVHQQWDFIAGLHLNALKHVTIDGSGSELLFHNRMTPIIIHDCEDVRVQNLKIDHVRPTVSEFTVKGVADRSIDVEIHPDSWYKIDEGKLFWEGADGDLYVPELFQSFDPGTNITRRVGFNLGVKAEEIGARLVRFHYTAAPPEVFVGQVWQMRGDGVRKQQGSVVLNSKDILWEDIDLYFCTGLGIVSQLTENLTFRRVNVEPREGSGRTCASFADGFHCCNLTGTVTIEECRVVGTQDDPINVYGDDLVVQEIEEPNQLLLHYPSWEDCGYLMLFPGDELVFRRKESLLPFATARVARAELVDKRTQRVVLDREAPTECLNQVVENRTRMPEVVIRNNHFARVPTRGTLVSSWKKTVIENNTYEKMQMAAIFVCHGDDPYFQQGPVADLTIRNNTFIQCQGGVFIQPDQPVVDRDAPLDSNITIINNTFNVGDIERPILWARSARSILLKDNKIEVTKTGLPLVWLNGCSNVTIRGNKIQGDEAGRIEVVDFEPGLQEKGVIIPQEGWKLVKGELRTGSK